MSDLMVSVAAGIAVLGCRMAFIRARERVHSRQLVRRLDIQTPKPHREKKPLLDDLSGTVRQTRWGAALERYAEKSHPLRPFSDVIALLLIGLLAGGIAGGLMFGGGLLMVFSAAGGAVAADRIAVRFEAKRAVQIEQQLPDALELQAAALRAGRSTIGSLRILSRQLQGPLSDEVAKTLRSVDLATPLEAALSDLAARAPNELGAWVTAMQVHRQTGGNLSAILDSLAERLRERSRIRGDVRALTAQARLSGLVVSLAPAIFLLIMFVASRDEMRRVFASSSGLALLFVGLSLQAAGLIWIRSIMKVKLWCSPESTNTLTMQPPRSLCRVLSSSLRSLPARDIPMTNAT